MKITIKVDTEKNWCSDFVSHINSSKTLDTLAEETVKWRGREKEAQSTLCAIAQNPHTLAGTLDFLADVDEEIGCWTLWESIVNNHNASSETLVKLWKTKGEDISGNPNTPQELLDEFADDPRKRDVVVKNPNTSPETLAKIADSIDVFLQDDYQAATAKALFKNPKTPKEAFFKMAKNGSTGTKECLIDGYYWISEETPIDERTYLPIGALSELLSDPDDDIAGKAGGRFYWLIICGTEVQRQIAKEELKRLTESKATPPEVRNLVETILE